MARRSHESKRIEWADRLRRHAGSGLSISAFCLKHSMSEALFHYWKRRLRESGDWPEWHCRDKALRGMDLGGSAV